MFLLNASRILTVRTALAVATVLGVSACGGGGSASRMPAPVSTAAGGSGAASSSMERVTLSIVIPMTKPSSGQRRPLFVSPSTQSLTYSISTTATPPTVAASGAVSLTLGASGCVSSLASTICTLTTSFNLAPGSYTGSFATFDGPNGTGNTLSQNQTVPIAVTASTTNLVNISLGGIVNSVVVAAVPNQPLVVDVPQINLGGQGKTAQAFALLAGGLPGTQPARFTATALDVDGNTIVGSGAPSFAVSQVGSGLPATISQPGTGTNGPNTFTLTPNGTSPLQFGIDVAAMPPTGTPACSAGSCSAAVGIAVPGIVATSAQSSVLFYADGSFTLASNVNRPSTNNFCNTVNCLAFDTQGNLFILDDDNNVDEIAPPYTTAAVPFTIPPATAALLGTHTNAIAVDTAGNVYVAATQDIVVEFVKASSFAPTTFTLSVAGQPHLTIEGIAVNGPGTAFVVANNTTGLSGAQLFQLKSSTPTSQSPTANAFSLTGLPAANNGEALALDSNNNAYVAFSNVVDEFSPSGGSPIATSSTNITANPEGIAVNKVSNTIAVTNLNAGIAIFSTGLTSPLLSTTIGAGFVTFDHQGSLITESNAGVIVELGGPSLEGNYQSLPFASTTFIGSMVTFP